MHEDLMLEIVEALGRAGVRLQAERTTIAIGVRRVIDTRHQRAESLALHRLARRECERAHRASVKPSEKRDDRLAARGVTRQLDAGFDRLGSGIAKERPGLRLRIP